MTQKEIRDGNIMIAEFMGYHYQSQFVINKEMGAVTKYGKRSLPVSWLSYNSNWNTLMQVVSHIESLGYNFQITKNVVEIYAPHEQPNIIVGEKKGRCYL